MSPTTIQIVQHLRPGGIETMALDLAKRFGPNAHIIALEGTREDSLAAWSRLHDMADRLHFIGKKPGTDPMAFLRLVGLLRKLKPAAVHTHHLGPMLYGGLAARLAGAPRLVHTEHDAWYLDTPKNARLHGWIRFLTRPAIVADCQSVADALSRHMIPDDIVLVRNGVDTDMFRPGDVTRARACFGLPEQVALIGCAARLEPVKGHELLINAVARLDDHYHLALAGDGSQRDHLEAMAEELGIRHRVHFLGAIDDMARFYQALDAFCLTSHAEGLPLSPLEAQACDVPVVLTKVGGCAEAVCPNTGRLLGTRDAWNLAFALVLAADKEPGISPREFIRRHADQNLTSELYRSLLLPEEMTP